MSRGAKRNMYELQMTVKLSRYPEGCFHFAIDLAGTMLMKLKIHTFNDVKNTNSPDDREVTIHFLTMLRGYWSLLIRWPGSEI